MIVSRCIAVVVCLVFAQTSLYSQTTYTAVAPGVWESPTSWIPTGIPGPNDSVVIARTVTISSQQTVRGFSLLDATIVFRGFNPTLTITGTATWYDGGEMDGGRGVNGTDNVNSTFIINAGARLVFESDATPQTHHLYEGTTLINRGTIILGGNANLGIRGLAVLRNEGLFEVVSDADFSGESFSGGTLLNTSTGVFRKSGGIDITSFNLWWIFQNDGGTIEAQSGTLRFDCNGTFTNGIYNAASGALMSFASLAQTIKGILSGSPSGDVRLAGSTISVDSSGATLDFQGNGFQWSRGTFTGGGILTIPGGSLLRLVTDPVNPQNQTLYGGTTLLNLGTVRQESNNSLSIRNNSVVDNRSLFDVTTDADFTGGTGSGGTFINTGTFRKSGGTDLTSFDTWWNFQNQGGTINAQSGSIHFIGLGTFNGGNYIAASNAAIDFRSSTQSFKGTLSGSPVGAVRLSGSTINIDTSGATVDFQGTGFQFSNGVITGGGTLTIPQGSLVRLVPDPVDPTPFQFLRGGTTILNLGTIKQESNTTIGIRDLSIVDNRSLFEILTDADFSGGTGSGGTFLNTGTFRKSGGNAVTQMDAWWKFFNQSGGVIDAASGELEFTMTNSNFANAQGAIIQGSGSIDVPNSFTNNGITAPGNGVGALSYIGNFVPSSTGVLDVQIGGLTAGSEHDRLIVTGNATLGGQLRVRLANSFVPAAHDSFTVVTTSGSASGNFSSFDIQQGLHVSVHVNANNVTIVTDSITLAVEEVTGGSLPNDFRLLQNYPNPFNPGTTIQFALPQAAFVTLEVFNVAGERLNVLTSENLSAGEYRYEWNAANYTSGVYFYRLRAGDFVETRKMIMLK
ncbi:MAG: T9SS type A sorting domain-containing protein [bacterium]